MRAKIKDVQRVVVKLGSNLFFNGEGSLALDRVSALIDDLAAARLAGREILVVSSGAVALGNVDNHYPSSPYMPKRRVEEYADQWGPMKEQRVLDVALAWSVINSHFDVADFLVLLCLDRMDSRYLRHFLGEGV